MLCSIELVFNSPTGARRHLFYPSKGHEGFDLSIAIPCSDKSLAKHTEGLDSADCRYSQSLGNGSHVVCRSGTTISK
jgi:hypothetical protein